jgi:hypothetical protein
MKKFLYILALSASGFITLVSAQEPAAEKKPYQLVVWADVGFDDKSQLAQMTFPEKDQLPKSFVGYLTSTLGSGSFTKPENPGAIKSLESGLKARESVPVHRHP